MKELAAKRTRFGYRRLTVMLLREGMPAIYKRVYRLYREERFRDEDSATALDPLERRGDQPRGDSAERTLVDRCRE